MLRHVRVPRSSTTIRRCLACGYGGRLAVGGHSGLADLDECVDDNDSHIDVLSGVPRCPRCACDFKVRPPRSYAEMEGLEFIAGHDRRSVLAARETRMVERWLGVLFLAVIGCVIVASLITAAVSPFSAFGG